MDMLRQKIRVEDDAVTLQARGKMVKSFDRKVKRLRPVSLLHPALFSLFLLRPAFLI